MKSPDLDDIVLFDGVCNFCDASVQFIIRKEKKPELKFASLQSETGIELLKKYELFNSSIDSIVYIKNGKAHIKSSAALHIAKKLKGLYPLLFVFIVVPSFIRDAVYDFVARNRYKWFGKKETCAIPDPSLRKRFVDL
jgi:predicted DCC family thiol-disulfide oxidoreductase YuxK